MGGAKARGRGRVALERALSKLGAASRAEAQRLIRAGRVEVDGAVITNPLATIVPERASIAIDGVPVQRAAWRTIAFHKPRGVVTTRRDPEGRRTVFDLLGDAGRGLVAVGRLDLASTGLLLLTTDTQLANRLTDPANGIVRRYIVTVRGAVGDDETARLEAGIAGLRARQVNVRKRSRRETHLIVELDEGQNREVRRLFAAISHEVTSLKRVAFGAIELGSLEPGGFREVTRDELRRALRIRL
jgi:23S rRNA pseudouridine2605 synthase